jgi:hypothetical protein
MSAWDILFTTKRFTLPDGKETYIVPCYFGEDVAKWLQSRLANNGISARDPRQADWGWYFEVKHGPASYLVGVRASGKAGEWRIRVQRDQSFWQMLTKKTFVTANDPIASRIESLLRQEPDFRDVKSEAAA